MALLIVYVFGYQFFHFLKYFIVLNYLNKVYFYPSELQVKKVLSISGQIYGTS